MKIKFKIKLVPKNIGLWNQLKGTRIRIHNPGDFSIDILRKELFNLFYGVEKDASQEGKSKEKRI